MAPRQTSRGPARGEEADPSPVCPDAREPMSVRAQTARSSVCVHRVRRRTHPVLMSWLSTLLEKRSGQLSQPYMRSWCLQRPKTARPYADQRVEEQEADES